MADIIKDSFSEANNHSKVVIQRGRRVLDFELNEMQDIQRVALYRALYAVAQDTSLSDAYPSGKTNPASAGAAFKVTASGSPDVQIASGYLLCDGIPVYLDATSTYTPTAYAGTPRTDVIYAGITEVEVSDPAQLAKAGETSRRREIQITIYTSTTGMAGVPASSVEEIWNGGVRYFVLASIDRTASNILANQVTDERYLLPGQVLRSIVRIANGQVQALTTPRIATPLAAEILDETTTLTFDVDESNTYPYDQGTGVHRKVLFKAGGSSLCSVGEYPFTSGTYPTLMYGFINRADGGVFGSLVNPVRFWDSVHETYSSTYQGYTDLSRDEFGSRGLMTENFGAVATGQTPFTIFKKINSRAYLTVGDGNFSTGDFTGSTALDDALAFVSTYLSSYSVHIYVKRGVYQLTGSYTVSCPNLIIEGEGLGSGAVSGSGSVISRLSGVSPLFTVSSGKLLHLKGLAIRRTNDTPSGILATVAGSLAMDSCDISHMYVVVSNPTPFSAVGSGFSSARIRKHVVDVVNCRFVNKAAFTPASPQPLFDMQLKTGDGASVLKFRFKGIYVEQWDNAPVFKFSMQSSASGVTPVEMQVDDSQMRLGSTTSSAGVYDYNVGFLQIDPALASYGNAAQFDFIRFTRCYVQGADTSGSTTTSATLLNLTPHTGTTSATLMKVRELTFDQCTFYQPGNATAGAKQFDHFWIGESSYLNGNTISAAGGTNYAVDYLKMSRCAWRISSFGSTSEYISTNLTAHGVPEAKASHLVALCARDIDISDCTIQDHDQLPVVSSGCGEFGVWYPQGIHIDGLRIGAPVTATAGSGTKPNNRVHVLMAQEFGHHRTVRNVSVSILTTTTICNTADPSIGAGTNGWFLIKPSGRLDVEACFLASAYVTSTEVKTDAGIVVWPVSDADTVSGVGATIRNCSSYKIAGAMVQMYNKTLEAGAAYTAELFLHVDNCYMMYGTCGIRVEANLNDSHLVNWRAISLTNNRGGTMSTTTGAWTNVGSFIETQFSGDATVEVGLLMAGNTCRTGAIRILSNALASNWSKWVVRDNQVSNLKIDYSPTTPSATENSTWGIHTANDVSGANLRYLYVSGNNMIRNRGILRFP